MTIRRTLSASLAYGSGAADFFVPGQCNKWSMSHRGRATGEEPA